MLRFSIGWFRFVLQGATTDWYSMYESTDAEIDGRRTRQQELGPKLAAYIVSASIGFYRFVVSLPRNSVTRLHRSHSYTLFTSLLYLPNSFDSKILTYL